MRLKFPYCLTLLLLGAAASNINAQDQCIHAEFCEFCRIAEVPDSLIVKDPVAAFDSLPQPAVDYSIVNYSLNPKVFSGYQEIIGVPELSKKELKYNLSVMTPIEEEFAEEWGGFENPGEEAVDSEIEETEKSLNTEAQHSLLDNLYENMQDIEPEEENGLPSIIRYKTPQWLRDAIYTQLSQENLLYSYMIDNPLKIEYAYWDLPLPPVLLEEDRSFKAFLKKQVLPVVDPAEAILPEIIVPKKHWLHKVGALLQFSQAYVSPNWYQGGNNYLSLLVGFNWNVTLNQVYHPNLLFQSDLQYKMAMSSNPKGYYHRYTIAEDNFQYNLNAGLKAAKNWYYSFNLQFKTQLLNNYEEDSEVRTAALLSPGDLNMGLGMSYNRKNSVNTFQFTLTISPLSYNLKTCISDKVNHETYSIPQDKKAKSEVGSNLDFTMDWIITPNISYKTRVFMFTNYKYYLGDWQNTFNFEINKFLSTQLFVHLRYDGSVESYGKWKKFMMREILSFGLSYTFSTKP